MIPTSGDAIRVLLFVENSLMLKHRVNAKTANRSQVMHSALSDKGVTLHLPEPIMRRAKRLSQERQVSIENLLAEAIATALPPLAGLPEGLAEDLSRLVFLSDDELANVMRETLPPEHHEQMDALLDRKNKGQLSASEQGTIDHLLSEYHRLVLRRGQAAVLLKARGQNVSDPQTLNARP